MKSKNGTAMKQIACQQCKKIVEKPKYSKPDPKYCNRTCYAQALRTQPESQKAEQIQEYPVSLQNFLISMICGVLTVIILGYLFTTIMTYMWS